MSGKRVRTISIIFLVILSQQLFAQRIDSAKSIKGAFDAIQTINQILEVLDKPKDSTLVYNEYTIGTIDSICNSKKDSWDFADEDSPLNGANNLVLGNSLKYKSHLIGSFEVINVTYNHWFLLEIKFNRD